MGGFIEHVQWMWHANREHLHFRDTWFRPFQDIVQTATKSFSQVIEK